MRIAVLTNRKIKKVIYNLLLHSVLTGDGQTRPTVCRTDLIHTEVFVNFMAMKGAITLGNKMTKENVTSPRVHDLFYSSGWKERDALKKS